MRTLLFYGALGLLGMLPVFLVLSVWDDEEERPSTEELWRSSADQAWLDEEAHQFALNRDGCELALRQVSQVISRQRRGAKMTLDHCEVEAGAPPEENVARGSARYLGSLQWDPPVAFRVWFVRTGRGNFAPCAVQIAGRGRRRASSSHGSCPDWRRRS